MTATTNSKRIKAPAIWRAMTAASLMVTVLAFQPVSRSGAAAAAPAANTSSGLAAVTKSTVGKPALTATEVVTAVAAMWPGWNTAVCLSNPDTALYGLWAGRVKVELTKLWYGKFGFDCPEELQRWIAVPFLSPNELLGNSFAVMYPGGLLTVTEPFSVSVSDGIYPTASYRETWLSSGKYRVYTHWALAQATEVALNGVQLTPSDYKFIENSSLLVSVADFKLGGAIIVTTPFGIWEKSGDASWFESLLMNEIPTEERGAIPMVYIDYDEAPEDIFYTVGDMRDPEYKRRYVEEFRSSVDYIWTGGVQAHSFRYFHDNNLAVQVEKRVFDAPGRIRSTGYITSESTGRRIDYAHFWSLPKSGDTIEMTFFYTDTSGLGLGPLSRRFAMDVEADKSIDDFFVLDGPPEDPDTYIYILDEHKGGGWGLNTRHSADARFGFQVRDAWNAMQDAAYHTDAYYSTTVSFGPTPTVDYAVNVNDTFTKQIALPWAYGGFGYGTSPGASMGIEVTLTNPAATHMSFTVRLKALALPPTQNLLEYLAFATINPGGPVTLLPMAPAFVSTTKDYVLTLPFTQTSFQLAANSLDDAGHPHLNTTLQMGGALVAPTSSQLVSGTLIGLPYSNVLEVQYSIQPGITGTLVITSTDASGLYRTPYTVTVMRSNALLSELSITPGELTPAFVSGTESYTAEVPYGTASVVVTPTVMDETSTYTITGTPGACAPATTPATCALEPGVNVITVTVTAADGETTKEYVLFVTVRGSTDATLSELAIDPGTLTPAFVSTTKPYTATAPNGTTSAAVTATTSDANATVTYASSAGACEAPSSRGRASAAWTCPVAAPTTWITVTVTAADGETTDEYTIEVTVEELPGSLTTIDRVWPGTGLAEGGMPVQIFGSGFAGALTVTVDGASVPFTITSDGQIDFVVPPGTAGESVDVMVFTSDGSVTAADAFTYVQPDVIEFDGETGGVFTTTDGVVVTIPPQGVAGNFVITMTPLPPEPGVPGSVLMYSFRLDALLNWVPLASLTNPVTIKLPIDENIFAIADGERPWLYQWIGGAASRLSPRPYAGSWLLVRGQEYDPGSKEMMVELRPMGVYALSTAYLRAYFLPLVPVLR